MNWADEKTEELGAALGSAELLAPYGDPELFHKLVASALRAARVEGLEEAAKECDAMGIAPLEPNEALERVAIQFAGITADRCAARIRALISASVKQKEWGRMARPQNPQITEARKIAERVGAEAVVVLAFTRDHVAAASYGTTKAKCEMTGKWLDAIIEQLGNGQIPSPLIWDR